jgi:hypothetical protein
MFNQPAFKPYLEMSFMLAKALEFEGVSNSWLTEILAWLHNQTNGARATHMANVMVFRWRRHHWPNTIHTETEDCWGTNVRTVVVVLLSVFAVFAVFADMFEVEKETSSSPLFVKRLRWSNKESCIEDVTTSMSLLLRWQWPLPRLPPPPPPQPPTAHTARQRATQTSLVQRQFTNGMQQQGPNTTSRAGSNVRCTHTANAHAAAPPHPIAATTVTEQNVRPVATMAEETCTGHAPGMNKA